MNSEANKRCEQILLEYTRFKTLEEIPTTGWSLSEAHELMVEAFLAGRESAKPQYGIGTKINPCTKPSIGAHSKRDLRNMLEDVVNELDLSASIIEEHGPLGTPPAELVRLVLDNKDKQIRMLKAGFKDISEKPSIGAAMSAISEQVEIVWCLFGIENDYDQPEHNLVCLWGEKPSIDILKNLSIRFSKRDSERLLLGEEIRKGNVDYRICQVFMGHEMYNQPTPPQQQNATTEEGHD